MKILYLLPPRIAITDGFDSGVTLEFGPQNSLVYRWPYTSEASEGFVDLPKNWIAV